MTIHEADPNGQDQMAIQTRSRYPTQDDVRKADPLLPWIDVNILRPDPFAFRNANFQDVVQLISSELDVDPNGVFCIGSGAVGMSFNPAKILDDRLKSFGSDSDIDMAVISEVHFEMAWRDLRRATQPVLDTIDPLVQQHLSWQRKKFFDGAILAHKLLPVLSFGSEWVTGLTAIGARIAQHLEREIPTNMWIYRDYWSLRNYVATGVVACRRKMI